MSKKLLLPLLLFPLLTGTTYVVHENGIEVGRYIENDGRDETRKINDEVFGTDTAALARPVVQPVLEQAHLQQIRRERAYWSTVREKRQDWGIRPGMSRAEVEQIAENLGVPLFSKYSEGTPPPDISAGQPSLYWVLEYRYKTDHFDHIKKIYFGPDWRVHKITDAFEEREY